MSHRKPSPEDLAARIDGLAAPIDEPEARNLKRLYDAFVSPPPLPAEADAAAADAELERRLAHLTPLASARDAAATPPSNRRPRRLPLRPALAMAAVLLVAVGLVSVRELTAPEDTPRRIMRGEASGSSGLQISSDGQSMTLGWTSPAGADAVRILLLDRTMKVVQRIDAGQATSWRLGADRAPTSRYVQLEFLTRGDVLQRSRIEPLP